LDELEITELMLSEVLEENDDFRFDSEYSRPEYIKNDKLIKQQNYISLAKLCTKKNITKGETPTWQGFEYLDEGIPFVRSQNTSPMGVNIEDLVFISENYHKIKKRSEILFGDSLLAIVGATIGQVGYYNLNQPANCNQAVAIIRPDDKNLQIYLNVFLQTKALQLQIKRLQGGNARDNLDLEEVRKLKFVYPKSETFQSHIADLVQTAHSKLEESKKLYLQAEQILLEELGLGETPRQPAVATPQEGNFGSLNISVKNFSESFGVSGRLDAEYYQPKYDQILEKIRQFKHLNLGGEDGLVDIFKSIEPGSEAYQENGIPFVRVSNLNKNEISEPEIKLNEKQFGHIKKPKKDDILLSKDGSVGLAYKCQKDENFITSGAILHLTIKNTDLILPDYLTLVLNSKIVQLQAQRDAGGSIIQHWKPSEIEAVLIPLLPSQTQSQIAEFIQTSFKLRTESKELLERAKLEVEEEVEKG
jgi:type I restriction enzyme S subunit